MKLTSYLIKKRRTFGAVVSGGIIDLGQRMPEIADLRALLAANRIREAARVASGARADHDLSEVTFLPVIENPEKIVCIGLNYKTHIAETGRAASQYPVVFLRVASSQAGHLQPLVRPEVSTRFDYEGELALVIGREGRNIPKERALEYVAGYACYNDGSVRDWQRHTHQFTPGKNFPATGAFGPWLVTADEIPDPSGLELITRVNGQIMQQTTTNMMIFSIVDLIAYISTFAHLVPGDVIVTGTPGGVGDRREPPVYLTPGDDVTVEISGIGELRNPVVAQERLS